MPAIYRTFTDDELRQRLDTRPDDAAAQREALRRWLADEEPSRLRAEVARLEQQIAKAEEDALQEFMA